MYNYILITIQYTYLFIHFDGAKYRYTKMPKVGVNALKG